MWINPSIDTESFQALSRECHKQNLRLWLARNWRSYNEMGANYGVYCRHTGLEIFCGDSLQEIADYLKIGGEYE